jgi:phenylpyruvate tautomerase PptA (4-oxalocrotonate tautomerase family)
MGYAMPYLQFDLPGTYPIMTKRLLAARLAALYAEVMQTTPGRVNVAFRELGDGNVWRCFDHGPEPVAVVHCDVRRGRPPEQRRRLAEGIVAAATEAFGLRPDHIVVEFTQHAPDEMYRDGAWAREWGPAESN